MPYATPELRAAYRKIWYSTNRESNLAYQRLWRELNPERKAASGRMWAVANREHKRALDKAWHDANWERRASQEKTKLKTDIQYRISHYLRTRMTKAIRRGWKAGSAVRDLGCTIPEFMNYIGLKFKPGMSWDNHGKWHLDHIRPLSSFDLTNREQFLRAAHYTNYQPLWARENMAKGDKVPECHEHGFEPSTRVHVPAALVDAAQPLNTAKVFGEQ